MIKETTLKKRRTGPSMTPVQNIGTPQPISFSDLTEEDKRDLLLMEKQNPFKDGHIKTRRLTIVDEEEALASARASFILQVMKLWTKPSLKKKSFLTRFLSYLKRKLMKYYRVVKSTLARLIQKVTSSR